MNKYVYRLLCKNYEAAALAMLEEWRKTRNDMTCNYSDVMQDYKDALHMLRNFLDAEGMVMPLPKWQYSNHDESTWLFTNQSRLNKDFYQLRRKPKNAIV